jgi:hypothetical protein
MWLVARGATSRLLVELGPWQSKWRPEHKEVAREM